MALSLPSPTELRALVQQLSPQQLRELDALLLAGNRPPPRSYQAFLKAANPGFGWPRHIQVLGKALEDVAAGKIKRLAVFLPVRHGKSEQVSKLGAAYFLRRHPDRWVAITSYSQQMANIMSRGARSYYRGEGPIADKDLAAGVEYWETGKGGGMWATGREGSLTGKGFHLGIIDDPVKDAEEAASEVVQQKLQDWLDSTFWTRRQPGAAIILVMARWHERDLAGYILEKEAAHPEGWTVLHFPAIMEPAPPYPPSCAVLPDWRQPGEALWPEVWPLEELTVARDHVTAYYWNALFQQRPTPREGNMFKRAWFSIVDSAPLKGETLRYWDMAATDGDGDWTVGVKMRRHPDGKVTVLDVSRGQWSPDKRNRQVRACAEADGLEVRQRAEREGGASGKDAGLAFVRLLQGFSAATMPATGDKVLRAEPFAAAAEAGDVRLIRAPWNAAYLDEMAAFPYGAHDDQVDGSSGAFNLLAKRKPIDMSGSAMEDLEGVNPWAEVLG